VHVACGGDEVVPELLVVAREHLVAHGDAAGGHLTGNQRPGAGQLSGEPRRHGMQPRRRSRGGRYRPGVDGISNTVHPSSLTAIRFDLCGPDRRTPPSSLGRRGRAGAEWRRRHAGRRSLSLSGRVHLSSVVDHAGRGCGGDSPPFPWTKGSPRALWSCQPSGRRLVPHCRLVAASVGSFYCSKFHRSAGSEWRSTLQDQIIVAPCTTAQQWRSTLQVQT
jgi:hypothetical protein